jgi:hypothetical protein
VGRPVYEPIQLNDVKLDRLQANLASYLAQLDAQVAAVVSPAVLATARDAQVTTQVLVDYRGPGGHTVKLPLVATLGNGRAAFVHVLNNGNGPITVLAIGKDTIAGAKSLALPEDSALLAMGNGEQSWLPLSTAPSGATVLLTSNAWWSIVDSAAQNGTRIVAGNQTSGQRFLPSRPLVVTAVRFYWHTAGSAKTIRCKIYVGNTALAAASVDVAVNASGIYVGTFATPLTLTPYVPVQATIWETTGSFYTDCGVFVPPGFGNEVKGFISTGPYLYTTFFTKFVTGDASPNNNAANEVYPVEPIFATTAALG